MKCIFSVDVEDWFHILDVPATPEMGEWDSFPSRIESNFLKLLDIFSEAGVTATCFFLGWVAQKYPRLVKEADRRGHETASHGFAHRLVYRMTEQEFRRDAAISKEVIEDTVGHAILGYRTAGFSVTERTPWFFDGLIEAGYRYDSSVFPVARGHGGLQGADHTPYRVRSSAGEIVEFPLTVAKILTRGVCFFGGGYFRLFPFFLIKAMTHKVLQENRPVIFYVHPREIDPLHPRLPMNFRRRFKCYVNLRTTEGKIRRLLAGFDCTSFQRFIAEGGHGGVPAPEKEAAAPEGLRLWASSGPV